MSHPHLAAFEDTWVKAGDEPERSSTELTESLGLPVIRHLQANDVATMKSLLSAGWIILATTRITDGVRRQLLDPFIWNHGFLMTPLPGEVPEAAHTWCIVGYEHVDNDTTWRYQGRFVALGAWGASFASAAPHGPGTLTLPFAFMLTEGIEAYAIRFA